MLVFGYPTEHQKVRTKPARFAISDMVCENAYQGKSGREIRSMFAQKTDGKEFDQWMEAFWKRKYESDFSREMSRSMEVYLKEFLEK